eukprot:COSAG02_NODE_1279_length_13487_cov_7.611696_12_plen_1124_part_00
MVDIFDNPVADGQMSPPTPSREPPALDYDSLPARAHNVGWLKRREAEQAEQQRNEKHNWKYSCETGREEDLGPIKFSWAFAFRMGIKDDGPPEQTFAVKQQYADSDPIPLECWQLCHRLWAHNFHIKHAFSTLGDLLIILIGLPYKMSVEEATKMRLTMRLQKTKGMHGYQPEVAEQYAEATFSSAAQQGLTLFRLKVRAQVDPDMMLPMSVKQVPKQVELKKMLSKFERRVDIRGRMIGKLMNLYGAHRPHAERVFGATTTKIRDAVLNDPWMVTRVPEKLTTEEQESLEDEPFSYEEIGQALTELQRWGEGPVGQYEFFNGAFDCVFPLHDKVLLKSLRQRWGTFGILKQTFIQGRDPEYLSMHSMFHPGNEPRQQLAMLWQPIDEIRDYFGDHVALYFAWMELYTRALFWPAGLGCFGMITQFTVDTVDDNPFTIPYSVFFAAWSIVFLSSWKRRENELKFLWGTEGFEARERPRSEFKGAHVVNPETNRDEIVYTQPVKRMIVNCVSLMFSVMFCCVTIVCAVGATLIKDNAPINSWTDEQIAQATPFDKYGYKAFASFLNLVIIVLGGLIYEAIARILTDWENHRTPTEWEDSIIFKNFLFQFINNYFVLFYIAFIRPFGSVCEFENQRTIDGSGSADEIHSFMDYTRCSKSDLPELQLQLIIVFTGKTLGWRIGELGKPKAKYWLKEMLKLFRLTKLIKQMEATAEQALHSVGEVVDHTIDAVTDTMEHKDNQSNRTVEMSSYEISDRDPAADDRSARQIQAHVRGHLVRKGIAESNEASNGLDLPGRMQGGPCGDPGGACRDSSCCMQEALACCIDDSGTKAGLDLDLDLAAGRLRGGDVGDEAGEVGNSSSSSSDGNGKAGGGSKSKPNRKEMKAQLRASYEDDSNVEDEYVMEPFESSFDEFNEMAVQYGYLALFAPAFPLAPLLALINNIFEIRIDAVKFCTVHRRPRFRQSEDIGAWYDVLNILGFLAVITNATMITFVGSQLGEAHEKGGPETESRGIGLRVLSQRLWTLTVLIEHGVMIMRIAIMKLSPENPEWVSEAKDTLEYRSRQMELKVEQLLRDGKTQEEISLAMNDRASRKQAAKGGRSKLKSGLKLLPGVSAGPKQVKLQIED